MSNASTIKRRAKQTPGKAQGRTAKPTDVRVTAEWDYILPPAKRAGTLNVTLESMGRGKPLPADDPFA
jgi:hypothetical protein